jgi:hypothetical protein
VQSNVLGESPHPGIFKNNLENEWISGFRHNQRTYNLGFDIDLGQIIVLSVTYKYDI